MTSPHLPTEITEEIACRLSPKNVTRLKTVSVSWNEMIDSSIFINSNLDHMMKQNKSLIILDQRHVYSTLGYEVTSGGSYTRTLLQDDDETEVVAHCRGLVCSADRDDNFFIFNPINFLRKDIPPCSINWIHKAELADACFGMGYVRSSDSYILLRLLTFHTPYSETHIDVYSSKTNTWKSLNPKPLGVPCGKFGIWVRGHIHFHVSKCGSLSTHIQSYNPTSETWSIISLPKSVETSNKIWEFSSLDDDTLAVFPVHHSKNVSCIFKVWILQGYGAAETWTRINISFSPFDVLPHPFTLQPLLLIKPTNKIILFRKDPIGTYGIYDLLLNKWEDVDAQPASIINGSCCFYNIWQSLVGP